MARILVIDDEVAITDLVARALSRDGQAVSTVNDPQQVLRLDLRYYDLILCDVMMPGLDGFALVELIRNRVDYPIVFLTAKVGESDAIQGLEIGADDYIRKPFTLGELRAKVKAHLRRDQRGRIQVFSLGSVRFDMGVHEVLVGNKAVNLTPTEYSICEFLALNHGQVFSKEQIHDEVFGWNEAAGETSILMHLSNARGKLRQHGIDPIKNKRGVGYKWEV